MDTDILALIQLLNSRYIAHDKIFDFGRKAQYFTTDVISRLAFGKPFGFLAADSDVYKHIDIMERQLPLSGFIATFPGLIEAFSWPLLRSLVPSPKDKVGLGRLMGIAKATAAERFGPNKMVQKDMLGSFVARGLTQEEAEAEIMLQV
ncbi:hypothetical protein NEMBOFW57_004802 [Staphylotrichum longicolle]|uniref:Cytochrome P450 n=1 Tax=Staphylotrichum longicolle TaxID=669026 RepID=A0AAD4HZ07_9PEZI|nr:hypothetical protein NEMBOFW57_004802 [Staphylotrichum longicolle]